MKYKTREFYIARCEALDALNIELEATCTKLRAERDEAQFVCRNLQSENTALRHMHNEAKRDEQHIQFGALQERCKRLNANGVPAMIHRGHIIHARSRAVIQPGQFGVGT